MSEGHIDPTRAAFDAFKALPRGETIHMLNLVRFRDHAIYPSGHPDADRGWSGAEAYAEYGGTSQPIFNKLGGRIVWRGSMQLMLTGPAAEQWDAVFVAEYPDARLVGGATDVGLWITKKLDDIPRVIWLGRIAALDFVACRSVAEGGEYP